MKIFRESRQNASFDEGIQAALQMILVSPQFLNRIEHDPAGTPPGKAYRISDVELASRLSFFLWSTIPDEQLITVASQGQLKDPAVFDAQVRRMLKDARSKALVDNFLGQWLFLRNLRTTNPDFEYRPRTLLRALRNSTSG